MDIKALLDESAISSITGVNPMTNNDTGINLDKTPKTFEQEMSLSQYLDTTNGLMKPNKEKMIQFPDGSWGFLSNIIQILLNFQNPSDESMKQFGYTKHMVNVYFKSKNTPMLLLKFNSEEEARTWVNNTAIAINKLVEENNKEEKDAG